VLRVTTPPLATWDALLPDQATRLPAELARIDAYLDDERFLDPWRAHFHARLGRPSIPIPTLLRLVYLKHRYQLGYQSLCREVSDSISWRRFCRIPLDQPVPHPTTLSKLVRRAGPDTIAALNTALLAKLAADKLLRCRKLRVDTTVVGANVAYPTDVGLLARAVSKLVSTSRRVQAAGGAPRTRIRDRWRSARRRAREVARALRSRSGDAKRLVFAVTRQVAAVAAAQLADAGRIVANTRRGRRTAGQTGAGAGPAGAGRCTALVDALQTTIQRTHRLLDQARVRLAGGMPQGSSRLVSLHDPDARPIRKGRIGHPVEFGYKAQVADNPDGIVLDHTVLVGNPPDAPLLAPAIGRVIARTGKLPGAVTADRGYGEAAVERELATLGVARIAIPRKGRAGLARQAVEQARPFRRLVKWRTGCEGRISQLKHHFGWARTLLDGIQGAQLWCGLGVFAHNLVKAAGLLAAKHRKAAQQR
jgi:IS5 family transposase